MPGSAQLPSFLISSSQPSSAQIDGHRKARIHRHPGEPQSGIVQPQAVDQLA
jgi:hypothetical protein